MAEKQRISLFPCYTFKATRAPTEPRRSSTHRELDSTWRMDLPHSPTRWLTAALLLFASLVHGAVDPSPSVSPEPDKSNCVRDDEFWLISTRHLCPSDWSDPSTFDFDVRRYDPSSGWQNSSFDAFLGAPSRMTVVYVHANR